MKKTPEKSSLLQDIKEIREKIAALESAEVRRENAAKVLDRARAEMETRIEKQSKAVRRAEGRLQEAETRNKQIGHQVRLLSSAVEQSTEGVSLCDLSGHLVYVNPAFAQMHGYAPDELIGKPLSICHTAEQMAAVEEANETLRKTDTYAGEIPHMRRDESVFAALVQSSILKDEAAKEIGIIHTVRDISQLRQTEAACNASETRFLNILDLVPDGVLICDDSFKITAVNKQACESLGIPEAELLKRSLDEIQKGFDVEKLSQVRKGLHVDALTPLEIALHGEDESELPLAVRAGLLESGGSRQMIVFLHDCTLERAAQDTLQSSISTQAAELENLNQVKQELEAKLAEQAAEIEAANELMGAQIEEHSGAIDAFQAAKSELEERIATQSSELDEAQEQLQARTAELEQLSGTFNDAKGELQAQIDTQAAELQKTQEALQIATEELESSRAASEETGAAHQKELDEKSAALAEATAQVEAISAENSQAVEEMLTEQVKLEEQLARQTADLDAARIQLAKLAEKAEIDEKKHKGLEDALAQAEARLEQRVRERTKSLEHSNAALRAELEKAGQKLERTIVAQDAPANGATAATSLADEMNASMKTVRSVLDTLKTSHRQQNYLMPGMDLGSLFRFERACKSLGTAIKNLRPAASEEASDSFNVNSVVGNTISPMIGRLKADGIKVNLSLSPSLPRATGSAEGLSEVIGMLIDYTSHAITSNPQSAFAEITIGTGVESGRITLRIADNGPTRSDAEIQSIFAAPSAEEEGVDISGCPPMLKDQNGEIEASRGPDGGTVFTVILPPE